jgi:hypothetical protein
MTRYDLTLAIQAAVANASGQAFAFHLTKPDKTAYKNKYKQLEEEYLDRAAYALKEYIRINPHDSDFAVDEFSTSLKNFRSTYGDDKWMGL